MAEPTSEEDGVPLNNVNSAQMDEIQEGSVSAEPSDSESVVSKTFDKMSNSLVTVSSSNGSQTTSGSAGPQDTLTEDVMTGYVETPTPVSSDLNTSAVSTILSDEMAAGEGNGVMYVQGTGMVEETQLTPEEARLLEEQAQQLTEEQQAELLQQQQNDLLQQQIFEQQTIVHQQNHIISEEGVTHALIQSQEPQTLEGQIVDQQTIALDEQTQALLQEQINQQLAEQQGSVVIEDQMQVLSASGQSAVTAPAQEIQAGIQPQVVQTTVGTGVQVATTSPSLGQASQVIQQVAQAVTQQSTNQQSQARQTITVGNTTYVLQQPTQKPAGGHTVYVLQKPGQSNVQPQVQTVTAPTSQPNVHVLPQTSTGSGNTGKQTVYLIHRTGQNTQPIQILHKPGQQIQYIIAPQGQTVHITQPTGATQVLQQQAQLVRQQQQVLVIPQNQPKKRGRKPKAALAEKQNGEVDDSEDKEKRPHKQMTRSGRVSRPPSYRVRDYKVIKTEDLADSQDSSEGEYSDYSPDSDDDAAKLSKDDKPYVPLMSEKPRSWKCETCEKAYIGRAGLGRHYRLYPEHGHLEPDEGEERTPGTPAEKDRHSRDNAEVGATPTGSVTSFSATVETSGPPPQSTSTTSITRPTGSETPVKRGPGRPPTQHGEARRKAKFRELLKQMNDEELMELALPRLTKAITLWEFLLMKVERGRPSRAHFPDVYQEYEVLHKHVQKMAEEYMVQQPPVTPNQPSLVIQSETVAKSVGITPELLQKGKEAAQVQASDSFKYKFLVTDPSDATRSTNERRVVEVVSPGELVQPPSKRQRTEETLLSETSSRAEVETVPDSEQTMQTSQTTDTLQNNLITSRHGGFGTVSSTSSLAHSNNVATSSQDVGQDSTELATVFPAESNMASVEAEPTQLVDAGEEFVPSSTDQTEPTVMEDSEQIPSSTDTQPDGNTMGSPEVEEGVTLMSHPGATVTQIADGQFLVTNPDGSGMKIDAPGFTIEAIQTLLAQQQITMHE
ncbi:PREDICTED: uncharacterized protein LOC109469164 [Branchiostoma belcheri]|uniref:Uncharacterized protein LOC109469164 n=1 Tax=Branchiostoma belcheri TaxID=7741 RepID=A0A6P4YFB2_BRABE|nr:PREDICTED: uncharacterized protein LOC109469164 [Branchiostoma belcheri]